jgi:hypothetical protein
MTEPETGASSPEETRCRFCGGPIEARPGGVGWVNIAGDSFCTFTPTGATERHHLPI